ncbi:MAG: SUF system NifU family Fe-S cluster assembly protein [Clostridium sp.]
MELNNIYTELIMEHSTSSHNRRHLEYPDVCEKGHNPSCGDEITLEIKYKDNILEDVAFVGQGCAISQASTSIMIDLIKGKTKEEALEIVSIYINMIKRDKTGEDELLRLEDAIVFKNISNMPARVKCAVIAWHTLSEAIGRS